VEDLLVELESAGGIGRRRWLSSSATLTSALAAFVDGLSEKQWNAPCPTLSTTVGVAAHHVAAPYGDLLSSVKAQGSGEPVGRATQARLDERNARHNLEYRTVSRSQVLDSLRRGATPLTAAIRSLTDDHAPGHLSELRDALRRPAQV
jgi:hypothetical protein